MIISLIKLCRPTLQNVFDNIYRLLYDLHHIKNNEDILN